MAGPLGKTAHSSLAFYRHLNRTKAEKGTASRYLTLTHLACGCCRTRPATAPGAGIMPNYYFNRPYAVWQQQITVLSSMPLRMAASILLRADGITALRASVPCIASCWCCAGRTCPIASAPALAAWTLRHPTPAHYTAPCTAFTAPTTLPACLRVGMRTPARAASGRCVSFHYMSAKKDGRGAFSSRVTARARNTKRTLLTLIGSTWRSLLKPPPCKRTAIMACTWQWTGRAILPAHYLMNGSQAVQHAAGFYSPITP